MSGEEFGLLIRDMKPSLALQVLDDVRPAIGQLQPEVLEGARDRKLRKGSALDGR